MYRLAASSLSGISSKAQKERDCVYHMQCMYRGLGIIGSLAGFSKDYKELRHTAFQLAGTRRAPKVSLEAAHLQPGTLSTVCTMPATDAAVSAIHFFGSWLSFSIVLAFGCVSVECKGCSCGQKCSSQKHHRFNTHDKKHTAFFQHTAEGFMLTSYKPLNTHTLQASHLT